MDNGPHRLLTVAETAEALGVSTKTVRRLIADRGLPAVQLGGFRTAVRIDPAELEAWLRAEPEDA